MHSIDQGVTQDPFWNQGGFERLSTARYAMPEKGKVRNREQSPSMTESLSCPAENLTPSPIPPSFWS